MARAAFHQDALPSFLQNQKIATLDELKQAIRTSATMTVFRRLKELGYLTSYSHRGKYYTMVEIAEFDPWGLWSYHSVWFSHHGNLLETARQFIGPAEAGLTAGELQTLLGVEVKQPLLQLYRQKQVHREKMGGVYLYFAHEKGRRKNQKLRRRDRQAPWEVGVAPLGEELSQELKASIILFFSLLDEKQRRLYAGLESFKLGHGGDRRMAEFLGLDVHTVARGRRDLFGGQVEREGVRKKGGGRRTVEKKRRRSSSKSSN